MRSPFTASRNHLEYLPARGKALITNGALSLAWALLACSSLACSSTPRGTIQLVLGEGDATAQGVTTWSVSWIDSADSKHPISTAPATASAIDLGSLAQTTTGILQVSGTDDAGSQIAYGSSTELEFGALAGLTVPLFVQRVGDVAALPNALPDGRPWPLLATVAGRYVVVTGGSDPSVAAVTPIYDLETLTPLASPRSLPLVPESIAFVGTASVAYVFGHTGSPPATSAISYDFQTGAMSTLVAPSGGFGFEDIVGGSVLAATDGSGNQFVVGATRSSGTKTRAVLEISSAGVLSWLALTSARWAAAATWRDSVGIVVAGGDSEAAGVEILDPSSATNSRALAYPSDPGMSSGAAMLDARSLVVAGGVMPDGSSAGVREYDLRCNPPCVAQSWAALPSPLIGAQAFALAPLGAGSTPAVTVVGTDLAGTTHVFVATSARTDEAGTAFSHLGARAVVSPLGPAGSVLLFGGSDRLESFVPRLM